MSAVSIKKIVGESGLTQPDELTRLREALDALDENHDDSLDAFEVADSSGELKCNAVTKKWLYMTMGPVENALFNVGLVKKLRKRSCLTKTKALKVIKGNKYFPPTKPLIKRSITIEMRRRSKNWWQEPKYRLENFLEKNGLYHRRNPKMTVGQLSILLDPRKRAPKNPRLHARLARDHYFTFPKGLPSDFVPLGRYGDGLKGDEGIHANARIRLKRMRRLEGRLFINATGHHAAVAAAFAERNIPTYWQAQAGKVSINSVRDYQKELRRNTFSRAGCAAIIVAPSHWFNEPVVATSKLPTPKELKESGMTKVTIFSENRMGTTTTEIDKLVIISRRDYAFVDYLKNLQSEGIEIEIIGVDSRKRD